MSLPPAEERKLQHRKIDQLDYLVYLFEFIAHKVAPGNMDLEPFRDYHRGIYARSKQSSTEVLRDMRTRPSACAGGVSEHDA